MGSTDEIGLFRFSVVANERQPQTEYMVNEHTRDHTDHRTDQGGGFNNISKTSTDATHQTVNHAGQIDPKTGIMHYFLDTVTGVHTNPIEGKFGFLQKWISRHPIMNENEYRWNGYVSDLELRHNYGYNFASQHFINILVAILHVKPAYGNAIALYVPNNLCYIK